MNDNESNANKSDGKGRRKRGDITRRNLLRKGLVAGGAAIAGLYFTKPSIKSLGVPKVYAQVSGALFGSDGPASDGPQDTTGASSVTGTPRFNIGDVVVLVDPLENQLIGVVATIEAVRFDESKGIWVYDINLANGLNLTNVDEHNLAPAPTP